MRDNINIEAFASSLRRARTFKERQNLLPNTIRAFEYDGNNFSILPTLTRDLSGGLILISNLEPEWVAVYRDRNFANHDPTVKHCLKNNEPLFWSDIDEQALTAEELEPISTAKRFYHFNGVTVPLWTRWNPYRFGMTFARRLSEDSSDGERYGKKERATIELIARVFFLFCDLREPLRARFNFPQKGEEVFSLLLAGKKRAEIPGEVDLSMARMKYYIREMTRKLGVSSTEQALVKYMALGFGTYSGR